MERAGLNKKLRDFRVRLYHVLLMTIIFSVAGLCTPPVIQDANATQYIVRRKKPVEPQPPKDLPQTQAPKPDIPDNTTGLDQRSLIERYETYYGKCTEKDMSQYLAFERDLPKTPDPKDPKFAEKMTARQALSEYLEDLRARCYYVAQALKESAGKSPRKSSVPRTKK